MVNTMGKNRSFLFCILIFLLQLIAIAVLVPSSIMKKASEIEYDWLSSSYSESSMEWISNKADSWHMTLTRDSGIAAGLSYVFLPERDHTQAKGMSRIGDRVWYPFIEGRGVALDEMVRLTMVRFASVAIWLPLMILIAIPALFDGVMERLIKQHTFKYPSPFLYRYGAKAVILGGFLTFAAVLAPIPLPPFLAPVTVMILTVVFALIVIGNLPKRV